MKKIKTLLLVTLFTAIIISGCQKKTHIEEQDLIGYWASDKLLLGFYSDGNAIIQYFDEILKDYNDLGTPNSGYRTKEFKINYESSIFKNDFIELIKYYPQRSVFYEIKSFDFETMELVVDEEILIFEKISELSPNIELLIGNWSASIYFNNDIFSPNDEYIVYYADKSFKDYFRFNQFDISLESETYGEYEFVTPTTIKVTTENDNKTKTYYQLILNLDEETYYAGLQQCYFITLNKDTCFGTEMRKFDLFEYQE